ncbi:MAG: hypothetical protein HRU31_14820 [Rhodobacteraceae bacterium]|nr:hypothetical protein [Paracoccaceae bacterium]
MRVIIPRLSRILVCAALFAAGGATGSSVPRPTATDSAVAHQIFAEDHARGARTTQGS